MFNNYNGRITAEQASFKYILCYFILFSILNSLSSFKYILCYCSTGYSIEAGKGDNDLNTSYVNVQA
ncbi:hypothetical protein EXN25_04905 [Clostridium botulinum]|nr:hypothetical protein [Clostridium botulinum]NFB68236.1 hypothetical protein [Clostridium botulinum]NFB96546.1 hypothetical protein [Clostridium botulinum]NFC82843.1 hypothetical protein [Clostridium botulinum]NFD11636.1 hypothetical protein [Clostridium botulinum]